MVLESLPGEEVRTARKSAIPTQRIAASVCGMGLNAYLNRENDQEKFQIGELRMLYGSLGTDGRDTIAAWVRKIFPMQVNVK